MKAMVSQPMAGLTEVEIQGARNLAVQWLYGRGYDVVDSCFDQESMKELYDRGVKHIPMYYLAKSIEKMAECDAVYFCKGWEKARGCCVEHEAAVRYGLTIFYEEG